MVQNPQPYRDENADISQTPPGVSGRPTGSAGEAAAETSDPNYTAARMGSSRDPIERGATRMDTGTRPEAGPAGSRGAGTVRDLMTADVNVCQADTLLYDVARMMEERDVGSIPVVDDTDTMKIIGVVTDRDITVRAVAKNQDPTGMRAGDVMSTAVLTVRMETPLDDCIRLMEERQVRRAPVIDDDGRLCGIIAQADIARCGGCEQAGELVAGVSESRGEGNGGFYH